MRFPPGLSSWSWAEMHTHPPRCMKLPRTLSIDASPTPSILSHILYPGWLYESLAGEPSQAFEFWNRRRKGSTAKVRQQDAPIDVNECRRPQERRVCHHTCHNTVGSFLCTCRPGFRLQADRVSCEGEHQAPALPSSSKSCLLSPFHRSCSPGPKPYPIDLGLPL